MVAQRKRKNEALQQGPDIPLSNSKTVQKDRAST